MYAPLSLCEAEALFVFSVGALPPNPGVFRRGQQGPSALFCLRRVHFWTPKSEPKKRQPPSGWTPAVAQSDAPGLDAAQPLKRRFLASDLWRVSCPASAVALLKG